MPFYKVLVTGTISHKATKEVKTVPIFVEIESACEHGARLAAEQKFIKELVKKYPDWNLVQTIKPFQVTRKI